MNECRYCTGVYCTIVGQDLGRKDAAREFQQAFIDGGLSGFGGDLVEFAVKLAREPRSVTDAAFVALRDPHGLSHRASSKSSTP